MGVSDVRERRQGAMSGSDVRAMISMCREANRMGEVRNRRFCVTAKAMVILKFSPKRVHSLCIYARSFF